MNPDRNQPSTLPSQNASVPSQNSPKPRPAAPTPSSGRLPPGITIGEHLHRTITPIPPLPKPLPWRLPHSASRASSSATAPAPTTSLISRSPVQASPVVGGSSSTVDFMNGWGVVTTSQTQGGGHSTAPALELTTIEQRYPGSSHRPSSFLTNRATPRSPSMPFGFDTSIRLPSSVPSLSLTLKRKHADITKESPRAPTSSNETQTNGNAVIPDSSSRHYTEFTSSLSVSLPAASDSQTGSVPASTTDAGRNGSSSAKFSAPQLPASKSTPRSASLPNQQRPTSSQTLQPFKAGSPAAVPYSPVRQRSLSTEARSPIKHVPRSSYSHSRSPSVASSWRSGTSSLTESSRYGRTVKVGQTLHHPFGTNSDHVILKHGLRRLGPSDFTLLAKSVQADAQTEELFPEYSLLRDEVWFEESMALEEIYEQQEAFHNKGQCMSSIRNRPQPPSNQPLIHTVAVARCRKHARNTATGVAGDDSCDDDCFEEYDPHDDTAEIQEAKKSAEKRSNASHPKASVPEPIMSKSELMQEVTIIRRPYLSTLARQRLLELGSKIKLDSFAGSQLHESFDGIEAQRVWLHVYNACPITQLEEFSPRIAMAALDELTHITPDGNSMLPGRCAGDVERYIAECLEGCANSDDNDVVVDTSFKVTARKPPPKKAESWHSLRLCRELIDGSTRPHLPASHTEIRAIGYRESLRFLQAYRTFSEGSSDVVDCAWDTDGRTFALACTTYNDMYNRPGNLMLGKLDGDIKFLCGHQTLRPPNQGNGAILDPYLHSTVSSVDFCNDLLFSSSYDKTVKLWGVKDRELRRSISFDAPVVRLKTNRVFELGAACVQNGDVVAFRPDLREDLDAQDSSQVFHASHDNLEPSSVLWTTGKAHNGWMIVGYDNSESDKRQLGATAGDLKIYDAVRGLEVGGLKPGSARQFDICLDENEQLLVTGSICGPSQKRTPDTFSYVRGWDLRAAFARAFEVSCKHKDINKVTVSPCNTWITSSGTNGKSYLWDVRRLAEPLHILAHGDSKTPLSLERDREEVDTGVTFASWVAQGSLIITGSSDGVVKVWDPTRPEPEHFLYNLASFDDPVMSGSLSPDGDALIIGETTGKATVLSYMGRHGPPEPFVQDRSMLAPNASELRTSECEESGAERAKELLRTGQVVLVSEDGGQPSVYGR